MKKQNPGNITIVDVAKRAGVSASTVSRVLNGNGYVSIRSRTHVERVMAELSFVPSTIARSLRDKHTKMIAIFIPDFSNMFYSEMLAGMAPEAAEKHYMIITCTTDQDAKYETAYIQQLLSRNIDGIIFFTYGGIRENVPYIEELAKKIPIVFMDSVFEHEPVSVVSTDGLSGTRQAVSYLIREGHRRIGYIKISDDYYVARHRYEGYAAALLDGGISLDPSLVYELKLDDLRRRSHEAGQYFLSLPDRPTAIMAVDDQIAIGTMNYLLTHGIAIPQQMAIVGFDNIPLSSLVTPSLTTVAQPIRQLGREAVRLLIDKIEDPTLSNRKIMLETKLVIRHSTDASRPLVGDGEGEQ